MKFAEKFAGAIPDVVDRDASFMSTETAFFMSALVGTMVVLWKLFIGSNALSHEFIELDPKLDEASAASMRVRTHISNVYIIAMCTICRATKLDAATETALGRATFGYIVGCFVIVLLARATGDPAQGPLEYAPINLYGALLMIWQRAAYKTSFRITAIVLAIILLPNPFLGTEPLLELFSPLIDSDVKFFTVVKDVHIVMTCAICAGAKLERGARKALSVAMFATFLGSGFGVEMLKRASADPGTTPTPDVLVALYATALPVWCLAILGSDAPVVVAEKTGKKTGRAVEKKTK